MKLKDMKNKILCGTSMIGLLGISYYLCRYTFFNMHGMKQWPSLLAILGVAIIIIASIFGNRIIQAATVVGYMVGFIIAMIFNTDGVDPGGGGTNNAWIIWGTILILSILIGYILNRIIKKSMKTEEDKF